MIRKWWYHIRGKKFVTGDFTPSYHFAPHAPKRIADELGPNLKIIFMLRDPITRAFSGYRSAVRQGKESRNFYDAIVEEPKRTTPEMKRMSNDSSYYSWEIHRFGYLIRGRYFEYLKAWHKYFSRDNIMVIFFEDFVTDPQK